MKPNVIEAEGACSECAAGDDEWCANDCTCLACLAEVIDSAENLGEIGD